MLVFVLCHMCFSVPWTRKTENGETDTKLQQIPKGLRELARNLRKKAFENPRRKGCESYSFIKGCESCSRNLFRRVFENPFSKGCESNPR